MAHHEDLWDEENTKIEIQAVFKRKNIILDIIKNMDSEELDDIITILQHKEDIMRIAFLFKKLSNG